MYSVFVIFILVGFFSQLLEFFVEEFFDQNPISQLGIIISRNKRAEVVTQLGGTCHLNISLLWWGNTWFFFLTIKEYSEYKLPHIQIIENISSKTQPFIVPLFNNFFFFVYHQSLNYIYHNVLFLIVVLLPILEDELLSTPFRPFQIL